MVDESGFTRFGSHFFRFICRVGGEEYASGVYFSEPCSDERFRLVFPAIRDTLSWLEQHIEEIRGQVRRRLPLDASPAVFDSTEVVSFSLSVHENENEPVLNVAYGASNDGVYVSVQIKNRSEYSVRLND